MIKEINKDKKVSQLYVMMFENEISFQDLNEMGVNTDLIWIDDCVFGKTPRECFGVDVETTKVIKLS